MELTDCVRTKRVDEGKDIAAISWDELTSDVKNAVRMALARAQGYLCAYCGGRIQPTPAEMRIEHWDTQHDAPERRFE